MPRRKSTAKAAATEAADPTSAIEQPTSQSAAESPREPATDAPPRAYAADPHPKITVSLSDYRGGPNAKLLRSHKFNQMQIRFEGEHPPEQAQAMLRDVGWRDRTEEEGIWTKQIDREARWQSVRQMEQEFKAVTNAIRQAKGLAPALDGLATD